jgi:hypothetical protein
MAFEILNAIISVLTLWTYLIITYVTIIFGALLLFRSRKNLYKSHLFAKFIAVNTALSDLSNRIDTVLEGFQVVCKMSVQLLPLITTIQASHSTKVQLSVSTQRMPAPSTTVGTTDARSVFGTDPHRDTNLFVPTRQTVGYKNNLFKFL